jgi:hypothetical protein
LNYANIELTSVGILKRRTLENKYEGLGFHDYKRTQKQVANQAEHLFECKSAKNVREKLGGSSEK